MYTDITQAHIQKKKNYNLWDKVHSAIATCNAAWLTDYTISKIIDVYQSYISKWKNYKGNGNVPNVITYMKLAKVAALAIKHRGHEDIKERILTDYKRFLTSQMYAMLQDWHSTRGSPHTWDELSTSKEQ